MSGGAVTVGRLVVSVSGDVDQLAIDMREAQAITGAATKNIINGLQGITEATFARNDAGKRMLAALQEEINTFGMSADELKIYKAGLLGVGEQAAAMVERLNSMKAAQTTFTDQLAASEASATQRIREMVAASMSEVAAMNSAAMATEGLVAAQTAALGVSRTWSDAQKLQAQNMAGVAASMKSAQSGTTELSAATQAILARYDPLGVKLRALQSDLAVLRKEMGTSVDPAAIKAFQGLEEEIEKTSKLMQEAGADGFGQVEQGAKKSAFATAGATRELMVLGHEIVSGNFSRMPGSFLVLAQRMGGLSQLLGGANLGFVALAVSVAGVAAAIASGHEEMVAMNTALAATGNYAAMTRGDMERLAVSMTQTHQVTIGTANEIVTALVNSGKIGGDAIASVAKLAANYAAATGEDIDTIAPKLISLFEDPAKGAETLNGSMHFLTVTQLEHIAALQRTGDVQKAQDELAQAAAGHMPKQVENMSYLTKAINEQRDAWTKLWQAMKNWGKDDSTDPKAQAQKIRDEISELMAKGYSRQSPEVQQWQGVLDKMEPAVAKQKEMTEEQKRTAAAIKLQQDAWDAVKGSSTAYHIQALNDQLTLVQKFKPANDAQVAAQKDAIRKINDEIDSANRSIGAEARELTQQQITDQDQLALVRLKGVADDINNQYKLGKITKQQFDQNMMNNALDVNQEKQTFEMRIAHVAGLTTAERQAHLDKLKLLKEERGQIEANGAASVAIDEKKAYDDIVKATIDAGAATLKTLDDQIEKQKEHNAEIGKTKAQIELARQAQEDVHTAQLQSDADYIRDGLTKWQLDGQSNAIYQIRLADLDAEIEKRKEISGLLADAAVKEADAKAATDAANAWKRTANTIENDLAGAIIDGGGRGWRKLIRDMEMAFAKLVLQPILEPISGGLATTLSPFLGNSTIGASGVTGVAGGATGLAGLANTASSIYGAVTGGMTLSGGLGTGFMGSIAGGLNGAGIGSGLTSEIGLSIGNSIAGVVGPSVSSAIASGMGAVATALPWIGAAVAAVSIGKMAFGMGPKQIASQGMSGTLTADSLTGDSYSNWTKKGGWFRSDKHGTDTTAFSAQTVAQFTQGLQALETAASGFASSLGVSADLVKSYSKTFDITLTGDATKDQKAITDFFSGIGDEIANKLVPNLASFSKTGETASATLQRLAGDFQATDQAMQLIGKAAADAFGSTGMDSAKAREQLVNAFGSTSTMTNLTQSFATNFLTNAEKLVPVQKALDAAMASLGLSSVKTEEQFKAVVKSLDLTTQAGANEFASLMALNSAFMQVYASGKTVDQVLSERQGLQDQLDQLALSQAQQNAIARSQLDPTNQLLFDQLQQAKAVAQAKSDLVTAYDNEVQSIQSTIDRLKSFSQSLHSFIDSLQIGSLSTLTPSEKYAAAREQFNETLTKAQSGDVTAQGNLQAVAQSFLQASQAANASNSVYQSDYQRVLKVSGEMSAWANQQVTQGQASLNVLHDQVQQLVDINRGVMTVADAINNLAVIMRGGNSGTPTATSSDATAADITAITNLYKELFNRAPDAAGLNFWVSKMQSGVSMSDIIGAMQHSNEYAAEVINGTVPKLGTTASTSLGSTLDPAAKSVMPSTSNDAVAQITAMYEKYLGREPDQAGLDYFVNAVNKGSSLDSVSAALMSSPEYLTHLKPSTTSVAPPTPVSVPIAPANSATAAATSNAQVVAQLAALNTKMEKLISDQQTQSDNQVDATMAAGSNTASGVASAITASAQAAAWASQNKVALR